MAGKATGGLGGAELASNLHLPVEPSGNGSPGLGALEPDGTRTDETSVVIDLTATPPPANGVPGVVIHLDEARRTSAHGRTWLSADRGLLGVSPRMARLGRLVDVAGAIGLLAVLLPVFLLVALAIKATSRGPVFYRQRRVGRHGVEFDLYKFRSMRVGAEHQKKDLAYLNEIEGPAFKIRQDPRITPVGRFIRKASIDELPQLWNVVRGDMRLVGPRPPLPREVASYGLWEQQRLLVKPGLTCIWQVSGRSDLDFETWVSMDIEYIDTWSPRLDVSLLLRTIPAVLSGKGAY